MFRTWLESSVQDLYQSAVDAFPHTTMRQHAVEPIRITRMAWTPFLGMKTLFIKGHAVNENRHYNPIIVFKKVNYDPKQNAVAFVAADNGQTYHIERLSMDATNVVLRCECKDFFWRFNYYDWLDHSLFGRKRKKYEGLGLWEANPMHMPGMCKHLMKLAFHLRNVGLVD